MHVGRCCREGKPPFQPHPPSIAWAGLKRSQRPGNVHDEVPNDGRTGRGKFVGSQLKAASPGLTFDDLGVPDKKETLRSAAS